MISVLFFPVSAGSFVDSTLVTSEFSTEAWALAFGDLSIGLAFEATSEWEAVDFDTGEGLRLVSKSTLGDTMAWEASISVIVWGDRGCSGGSGLEDRVISDLEGISFEKVTFFACFAWGEGTVEVGLDLDGPNRLRLGGTAVMVLVL